MKTKVARTLGSHRGWVQTLDKLILARTNLVRTISTRPMSAKTICVTHRPTHSLTIALSFLLFSCVGTKNIELADGFPVPLMQKTSVNMGIHLDDALTGYKFSGKVDKRGEWEVDIGSVQQALFNNLATGLFEDFDFVTTTAGHGLDASLSPTIADMQFSLPVQTRSDLYEVWIKYEFELLDANGNSISKWTLPAYGKANKQDHGGSSGGIRAAAMAACRDAMAFFAINFSREPAIQQWLAAGKPSAPRPPVPAAKDADAEPPQGEQNAPSNPTQEQES